MHFLKILLCLLFVQAASFAQSISSASAEKFVRLLLKNSDSLAYLVHPEQQRIVHRLGISYPEAKNKFLIANDFDNKIKEMILAGDISYQYQIVPMDSIFSKVVITVPALNTKKEYYFLDSLLVLQPYYYGYRWPKIESRYFVVHSSEDYLTNAYAIENMDAFVDKMLKLMKFPANLVEQLKKEKIHYYLCIDENELQRISGNIAKGLYFMAADYILTTYNNHFHEICHLLMNYRLQNTPLYTQPFFQEGFAVGFGGRGGLSPETVLDMGAFIMYSGLIEDADLLSKRRFSNIDASISYPASGFLNVRLVQKIGFTQYLNLYRQYSGNENKAGSQLIKKRDIFYEDIKKEMALTRFDQVTPVQDTTFIGVKNIVKVGSFGSIKSDSSGYYFFIRNQMLVRAAHGDRNYKSVLFSELVPAKDYRGEKYLIKADENEISIYNLLTNTLIANYVKSFSGESKNSTQNLRFFKISKSLLDGNPADWQIN